MKCIYSYIDSSYKWPILHVLRTWPSQDIQSFIKVKRVSAVSNRFKHCNKHYPINVACRLPTWFTFPTTSSPRLVASASVWWSFSDLLNIVVSLGSLKGKDSHNKNNDLGKCNAHPLALVPWPLMFQVAHLRVSKVPRVFLTLKTTWWYQIDKVDTKKTSFERKTPE